MELQEDALTLFDLALFEVALQSGGLQGEEVRALCLEGFCVLPSEREGERERERERQSQKETERE